MIDAFSTDAALILHDPTRPPLSSIWDRFTGGFEAMLQGVLGVTASLWGAPLTTMSAAFHTPFPEFRVFSTIHSASPSGEASFPRRHPVRFSCNVA